MTRSFGRAVTTWSEMEEALASYATRAGEKLRRSGRAAGVMQALMLTNRFNGDPPYGNAATMQLEEGASDTRVLVAAAIQLGRRIWRDGLRYSKAGVVLDGLIDAGAAPRNLLSKADPVRSARLMLAMDVLNRDMGAGALMPAAAGLGRRWSMRSERRAPRYTTRWDELPQVMA